MAKVELRVQVRFPNGTTQDLTTEPASQIGQMQLIHAPLPSSLSMHPGMCTITVTARGHTQSERFKVGPECYTGSCDGVRDYCLEGWLTPLFSTSEPRVQLIVDGVAGDPVPLNRYRREFQFMATGQGGWNGFSLPLPPQALDGQPHHLAIKAGTTSIAFGTWASQPKYNIDSVTPNLLAGWYFDTGISDAPTTLRIVRNGVTQFETKTHPRADVKTAFGREISGFVFHGQNIQPGSQIVVGPEDTGLVLGQFENELHV